MCDQLFTLDISWILAISIVKYATVHAYIITGGKCLSTKCLAEKNENQ